ncbi:MAG: AAA family ATPase [Anaerolineae bacterium]|nr:AAA family ATPase [Anaerolineae bacterium]
MAHLEISLLGGLTIKRGGLPAPALASRKAEALLVYLLCTGRPHAREVLADLLWDDRSQSQALANLRVLLSSLRQALGPYVSITRQTVAFNRDSPCWLDVAELEQGIAAARAQRQGEILSAEAAVQLAQALALYRGDFLLGFYLRASQGFEEWLVTERERLRLKVIEAFYDLIAAYLNLGEYRAGIEQAKRLLQLDPLQEEGHRQLMRLLVYSGQRNAALAQYDTCRRILADELGVEPTPETTALYERIRAGELSRGTGEHTPSGAPAKGAQSEGGRGRGDFDATPQHNLPVPPTSFLGREMELAQMAELLGNPACRLLTVVGPGGIGKTRLALQAALQAPTDKIEVFRHGVHFVSLAPVSSASFLVSAIAEALNFSFYGPRDPKVQLLNYLREKNMLLVLDNFEHLLAGVGLLAEILAIAPEVKLLVTSRERLNLQGEWLFEIQGLKFPPGDKPKGIEAYSAVQLFWQSARMVRGDISLLEADKPSIAQICRLVEGMPLGVELAAAWVRTLSCAEIAQEIERSLGFLTTSLQDIPARHRSIRAVFDHSWRFLSAEEREIFRKLSVFRGGFRREAAERVAEATLPLLSRLVDKSLLRWSISGRYEIHELLRQYAAAKLEETPLEKEKVQGDHGRYYLEFLQLQMEPLWGRQQKQALAEIRAEIDNVRLAWQWAVAHGQARAMGQAVETLWLFYEIQSWYREAEATFAQAATILAGARGGVEERERDIVLGQVLGQQGWFSLRLALSGKPRELLQRSLALLRQGGAQVEMAATLYYLGVLNWVMGEYAEAQSLLQEGLDIYRERQVQRGTGLCLGVLGMVAQSRGEYLEAKCLMQQAGVVLKESGNQRWLSADLSFLSALVGASGERQEAKQLLQESLALSREIGDLWTLGISLNHLGALTYLGGAAEWPEAKRLHQQSLAIFKEIGEPWGTAVALNHLGQTTYALGELQESKQYILAALKTAMEGQVFPAALEALVGLAALLTRQPEGETGSALNQREERALELIGLVWHHPVSSQETRDRANRLLVELKGRLPPQAVAAAQEKGRARIFEEVVAEILREGEARSVQLRDTPVLVGRAREWQQLMAAWQRVERGEMHCVLISGEAGIGKTRLAEELQRWAERQGMTTARSRAYAATRHLAYGPLTNWLRGPLQAAWSGLAPLWLTELARLLPELLNQRPDLPPPQPLTDSWQRPRLFEALARAVGAARLPCLLVLDDLQWADAETLEWLGYLLHFEPAERLLLVGTVRPEEVGEDHPLLRLRQDLRLSGRLSEMELGPLDAGETARLAEQVTGQSLATEVAERLYRETAGYPLFIVEMVRANEIQSDILSGAPEAAGPASRVAVPAKIQAVIEARLAQLSPPARELVNLAAVIGREFNLELLRATGLAEDESLVAALEEAARRRILREQGLTAYDFSHDKLRDIAYAGLSTARRRLLHSLVGGALEKLGEDRRVRLSDQLAYHYERAGLPEPAVRYYWQAAQSARQICALPETINCLNQGLALLKGLPDTPGRDQQAFNFLSMLGITFAVQKGYAVQEMGEAYQQALALAPSVEDPIQVRFVQFGLYVYYLSGADLLHAQELVQTMLVTAETSQEPTLLPLAYLASGLFLMCQGQFVQARDHLEKSLAQPTDQVIQYISEFRMINISILAFTLWCLGFPDQAQRVMSLPNQAKAPNDRVAQAALLQGLALLNHCLRRSDQVQRYTQEGIQLCHEYGLFQYRELFNLYDNWVSLVTGQMTLDTDQIRQTLVNFSTEAGLINLSRGSILVAEACAISGQINAALDTLDEAIVCIQQTKENFLEAEIYRLKGEMLLRVSSVDQVEAEGCFQHALAVARSQQAKSLELRAAMSLSRLWQRQGKNEAAQLMLAEIYNRFTEGFETVDLREAQALLEELQAN